MITSTPRADKDKRHRTTAHALAPALGATERNPIVHSPESPANVKVVWGWGWARVGMNLCGQVVYD